MKVLKTNKCIFINPKNVHKLWYDTFPLAPKTFHLSWINAVFPFVKYQEHETLFFPFVDGSPETHANFIVQLQ